MRILVTGGAGFIGSHLCGRLLEKGEHVICLDNFYTGQKENVAGLLDNPNFELIEHDINEPFQTQADQIYNLACPASPVYYQKDPVNTTKASTLGVLNILELARQNNARILQASTSEIYGDPLEHPQSENYAGNVNTLSVRACYDEGKRCAETLFTDYHRQHNLDIRIARIFNTYGPNMYINDGRVVSNFIVQALKGEDITVYGDGMQTRSFQYVDDLIDGLTKLMETKDFMMPVNIGNPDEITIKELAEKIIELTESDSKIVYKELPGDDPKRRCPDISLAKKELGWEPKISLEEGLKKTVEYFRKLSGCGAVG